MGASNARKWRLQARNGTLIPNTAVTGDDVKGRLVVGHKPGPYHHITVDADGGFHVSHKAYGDDVLAFVHACMSSNPTMDPAILAKLQGVIDDMDTRAVKRHGYSHSPEEAEVEWPKAK